MNDEPQNKPLNKLITVTILINCLIWGSVLILQFTSEDLITPIFTTEDINDDTERFQVTVTLPAPILVITSDGASLSPTSTPAP